MWLCGLLLFVVVLLGQSIEEAGVFLSSPFVLAHGHYFRGMKVDRIEFSFLTFTFLISLILLMIMEVGRCSCY